MPAVEERLTHLEGQVGEISSRLTAIEAITQRVEQRMDRLEQRMDRLEQRMDHLDERMNARFDRLEREMAHQFKWLVGIQITSLLTVVAALGAIIAALVSRT